LWCICCRFYDIFGVGSQVYKRIPHFMAVDSATKSLLALSIWRNSLLFMFIFVYYSAWNITFEHLHLCSPRCDQTNLQAPEHLCIPRCNQILTYKHLCIPRCIVYPLYIYNIYLSTKGCHNLSVTAYLVIVWSIYLSIHLYILIWYWISIYHLSKGCHNL